MWISVPVASVGHAIASNPLYDIDDGHLFITYKEFAPWIWHQMEHQARQYLRHIHHMYETRDPVAKGSNIPHIVSHVLARAAEHFEDDARINKQKRIQLKALTTTTAADPTVFFTGADVSEVESLMQVAKTVFPLCMSQIVHDALVLGKHPKHKARTSLVLFLLDCGYDKVDVDRVMFLLYAADRQFVTSRTRGGQWDDAAYAKEFKPQVKALHDRVKREAAGAYGCKKLVEEGERGEAHGCPYAKDVDTTVQLLGWSSPLIDIEDIMRPAQFANERCCRDYQQRHPDKPPVTVFSPLGFMGIKSNKRARVEVNGGQ
jgi:DNA primase large subunit